MDIINETQKGNYLVRTYYDNSPNCPRDDDNFGKMICFHNRYSLGDKHDYRSDDYNGWDELKEQIEKDYNVGVILPLYLYDHSGITMNTTGFSCGWDSGQVGWIFCTKEEMDSNWIELSGQDKEERSEVLLKGEVETYDKYIMGEVYGYRVFKVETCDKGCDHEEEVDSCWGYYDEDDCMEEGCGVMEYYISQEEVVV
jgi:hypothetical protein